MNKTLGEQIEDGQEKYDNCDCNGTPAKPWLYCDDCQEFRELLDRAMDNE